MMYKMKLLFQFYTCVIFYKMFVIHDVHFRFDLYYFFPEVIYVSINENVNHFIFQED